VQLELLDDRHSNHLVIAVWHFQHIPIDSQLYVLIRTAFVLE
jgi:hypothetical protein